MQSKLSDLVDNLSEINNKDCKTCMERKNIKSECDFIGFKNNRLNYRCKECKETCTKSINELIEKFPRMYQFCNGDLNKFVLLLRKGVYPYEYMDSWERFNETSLPPKKDFYSELTIIFLPKKCLKSIAQTWVIIMICMFKLIRFYLQMFSKNLETNALNYVDWILLIFILHLD